MPRFDIEFAVNGQTQTLTVTQRKAIRAGSKNYWYAVFALDATVAELSPLYATFSREPYHRNRGRAIIVPLERIADNASTVYECQIPWEVLTRKGSVFIGLFAGDMLVTNEVEIEVTEAAPTLGSEGHHTAPWYKPFVDALNSKQDKEAGKGLSSNDFTDEDKAKVAGIPANPHYTDTTYTAGDGISIDENNVISATGGSYSPYIGINGHWYEWSDADGDFVDTGVSAQGAKGDKGDTGAAGADGQDGADGFSPTASVSKVGTAATITITDKNGTTTATVNDGAKGDKGDTGAKGDTGDSGSFTCVYGVTTWAEFAAAVQAGKSIKIRNGISYGWADMIDIDNGYASFTIIAGEDYATSWCEFFADGGWMSWTGGALANSYYVQTALATKLDKTGNAYRAASIPMGTVDGTSTATAFTATVAGITELRDGVCMWLTNGVITSAEGFTININNLGAKPVYGSLAAATASTTAFGKNYTMLFVYNSTRVTGGCWDLVYGYDTNTTYTPVKLGFGYATCSTAAATAAKTASLSSYALNTGGIVAVKFTNAVPANATLNINSKGAKAIYYKGAAITNGVIKAGDTVTFMYSTQYHVLSIDRDEAPVTSVNGSTGAVTLTAADVGATPETFLVTVTESNGAYSADKTFAEISAAYAAGKRLMASFPIPFGNEYVNVLNPLVSATYGLYVVAFGSYIVMDTATGVMQYQLGIDNSSVIVTETPLQSRYMTATLTIATTDWNNGSCTKSVTGMTADALVFVKYSDTETEFTVAQGSNLLTFTAATTPSEAVTVDVAWFVQRRRAYDF